MPKDILKDFVASRQSLVKEKADIEARLNAINAALGGEVSRPIAAVKTKVTGSKKGPKKRAKNSMSLREAILKVVSSGPKTKQEILDGVQKLGYRFGGSDPLNSIGVVIYGKPKFENQDGKFSGPK